MAVMDFVRGARGLVAALGGVAALAGGAHAGDVSDEGGTARSVVLRPWSVTLDTGLGSPIGVFGAMVGYCPSDELEVAVGGGLGFTGIQAAVLVRWLIPVGSSPTMSWIIGGGPSLAFRSERLGFRIERATEDTVIDRDTLYHTAWLNAELGWVGRAAWGGVLRVTLGAGLRIADNQRGLCDGAPEEGGDCDPPHFGPGSIYARAVVLPSFAMGFGWAF